MYVDVGAEYLHNQQNCGGVSPEKLWRNGMRDPIEVDISTVRHNEYKIRICRSGEYDSRNVFASIFLQKVESFSPIVGNLSAMTVNKTGLVLLNPVKSVNKKYLSFQGESTYLIQAMTGEGAFSNASHLLALSEEIQDGQENWDFTNNAKIKGLVSYLVGTYRCPIIHTKSTVAWLKVQGLQ